MRHFTFLLCLATFVVAGLLPSAAAQAENYPPPLPPVSVSTGTVVVHHGVRVHGSGYRPHERVRIGVAYGSGGGQAVTFVTADSTGAFDVTVTMAQAGTALITATGETSGRTFSATVAVTVPSGLPTTGIGGRQLHLEVIGGVLALLLGTTLVTLTRRRRNRRRIGTSA